MLLTLVPMFDLNGMGATRTATARPGGRGLPEQPHHYPRRMPPDDEPDDASGFQPPLPPDDRLWRHPSELGPGGASQSVTIVNRPKVAARVWVVGSAVGPARARPLTARDLARRGRLRPRQDAGAGRGRTDPGATRNRRRRAGLGRAGAARRRPGRRADRHRATATGPAWSTAPTATCSRRPTRSKGPPPSRSRSPTAGRDGRRRGHRQCRRHRRAPRRPHRPADGDDRQRDIARAR